MLKAKSMTNLPNFAVPSKIFKKVVFQKYFKFCFYKVAKKLNLSVPLVAQISISCKLCKKAEKSWKP